MKKIILSLCAVMAIIFTGCRYDDSNLWNSVNDLEARVSTLEKLCSQMNTNINSLQTIVYALQDNDYITGINPLYEGDTHIGYTIDFAKSPSITIYHGKDGKDGVDGNHGTNGKDGTDGYTPTIGIAQDSDGHYYWTLDGSWLLDNNGNKILAEGLPGKDGQNGQNGQNGSDGTNGADGADGADGKDGKDGKDGADGITPQFKIENGDWYISMDNGLTWEYVGQATGADGKDGKDGKDGENGVGGDSMFSSIDTSNQEYIIFTLSNGTQFKIPRHTSLSISFDSGDLLKMQPNTTREIAYTISGGNGNLNVEVLSSGNVRAKISSKTSASGTLTITTGNSIDEYDKVIVLVSDGQATIMRSLTFEEAGLRVTSGLTYDVSANGATLLITVETATDFSVVIPSEAQSWISNVASRAFRTETVNLQIQQNTGSSRSAEVKLNDTGNHTLALITINQNGSVSTEIPEDMTVAFPDEKFRNYILDNFDKDKDGKISLSEAYLVRGIGVNSKEIESLEGIQYFVNLEGLQCMNNKLTSLDVSNLIYLKDLLCYNNLISELNVSNCPALSSLSCGYNLISSLDISECPELWTLLCYNNSLTTLDCSKNHKLEELRCMNNRLTYLDISGCESLNYLICTSNMLTELDVSGTILNTGTLECAMQTLHTLYVKTGWTIPDKWKWNYNGNTQIVYK